MISRRQVLKGLGFSIALPLIEPVLEREALAQVAGGAKKKRFIGCFFGSGAPMPGGANGDWAFEGGQYGGCFGPLAELGVRENVAIMRGFRAVPNFDVHWSGTASFLSSVPVGTGNGPADPNYQKCAKSFDQYIGELDATARIRSLHAGYSQLSGWDEGHDRVGSINYVNSIAWRDATTPIGNTNNIGQLFTRVFGDGGSVMNTQAIYLLKQRKSILDGVLEQYKSHAATLSTADKARLEAYATSIREVEGEIANQALGTTCTRPEQDGSGEGYLRHFRTIHKIVIAAMQCNLTRAATIMYNDGIGPNNPVSNPAAQQHDSAHNNWGTLVQLNRIQIRLWGELIAGLKAANLLGETVTVIGSNMSDGRTHNPTNIPLLVASQNVANEMKLGQEVYGTPAASLNNLAQNRNLADLHVDLFKLYGIDMNKKFGGGEFMSTGNPSGILA